MTGIYKITNNLNGKSYIGQSIDIKRRWREHKKNIGSNKNPLYLDFEKYGINNFTFEILENCTREELDCKEIYYINKFDTYNSGYNLTIGGQNNKTTSFKYALQNEMQKNKEITSKHWKIYYYLLSVSKFNAERVEDHRYVYKKDFNISACCRFLGVKSTQTFYNAIERLHKHHLVTDDGEHYILYAKTPIDVNRDVLTNLIEYSAGKNKEGNIDLLRTYLILKRINKLAESFEDRTFTKRELIILLGHSGQTTEMYENIRNYLGLLSMWGFIDIKLHTAYDEKLGKYTIYHLQNVADIPMNEDYVSDILAEKNNGALSQRMKDKLHFCESQIMEV